MAHGISVKLPLALSQDDGAYELNKDYKSMIRQNMKMLILTAPGERIMDGHYGVGLRNYLFLENTPSVINELSAKISEQIAHYMPFVEIEDLQVNTYGEEENILSVKIFYNILPLGESDMLTIDKKME